MDSKLNQDFIRYEQVEKRQSYHLAEEAREQFDDEFQIRTCDMRKPTFAQDLGDALHEIGFAIVEGHGVDPALYDEANEKVLEMFGRLTLEREDALSRAALRLGQSGLLPDQRDEQHASRSRRGMGVLPARVRGGRSNSGRCRSTKNSSVRSPPSTSG